MHIELELTAVLESGRAAALLRARHRAHAGAQPRVREGRCVAIDRRALTAYQTGAANPQVSVAAPRDFQGTRLYL